MSLTIRLFYYAFLFASTVFGGRVGETGLAYLFYFAFWTFAAGLFDTRDVLDSLVVHQHTLFNQDQISDAVEEYPVLLAS